MIYPIQVYSLIKIKIYIDKQKAQNSISKMLHTPKKSSGSGSLTNNHKNHKHYFNQTSTFRTQPNQVLSSTYLSSNPRSHSQYPQQSLVNRTPYHTHFHRMREVDENDVFDHGRSFIQVDIQQFYQIQGGDSLTRKQPVQNVNNIRLQIQSGKVKSQVKEPLKNNNIKQLQVMDYIQKQPKNNRNTNRNTLKLNQPIKIQQALSSRNISQPNNNNNISNQTKNQNNQEKNNLQVKPAAKGRIFGKQKKPPTPKQEQTQQKIAELRNYLKNNRKQLNINTSQDYRDGNMTPSRKLRQKQYIHTSPFESNNLSTLRQKNNTKRYYDNGYYNDEVYKNNRSFNDYYSNKDNNSKISQQKSITQIQILTTKMQNLIYQNTKLKIKDQQSTKKITELQQTIRNLTPTPKQKKSIPTSLYDQLLAQNTQIKQQLHILQQKNKQYESAMIKPVTASLFHSEPTLTQQQMKKIGNLMQDTLERFGALLTNRVGLLDNRCGVLEKNLKSLQQNIVINRSSYRKPQIQNKNITKSNTNNKNRVQTKHTQYTNLNPNSSSSQNRCNPHTGEQYEYMPLDTSQIRITQTKPKQKQKQSLSQSKLKQDRYVGSIIQIQSKIKYKYNNNGASRIRQKVSTNNRQEPRQKSRQKSTNTPQKWNTSIQLTYQPQLITSNPQHYNPIQDQSLNPHRNAKSKVGNINYSQQYLKKLQQKQRQQLLVKISQLQSMLVIQQHKHNIKTQQQQKSHKNKLSQLQQHNMDKITQLLQAHKKQLQNIQKIYNDKIKQLQQLQNNQLQNIQQRYRTSLQQHSGNNTSRYNQIQSANKTLMQQLQQQHKNQLNRIKQEYSKQIHSMEKQQIEKSTTWSDKQSQYKQNQKLHKQKYQQLVNRLEQKEKLYAGKFRDLFALVGGLVREVENCNMENFNFLQKQIMQIVQEKKHIFYKLYEYKHKLLLQEQIYKNTKVWQIQQQLNDNNKKIQEIEKSKKQLVQKCVRLQNYIQKNVRHGQLSDKLVIQGVYDGYAEDLETISDHSSVNQVVCGCPIDKIISFDTNQIDYDENQGKQAIKWVKHVQKALIKSLKLTDNILKIEQQLKKMKQEEKNQL